MPTLLILFGLRFYFYSNDHEPFHIHVESSDRIAKYGIENGEVLLIKNEGLQIKDLKLAASIIEENKEIFEKEWNRFFGKDA